MLQRIISIPLLICGIIYGTIILYKALSNRPKLDEERGSFTALAPIEALVYFCGAAGISDFLLNTLAAKRLHTVETEKLPGTLVACCLMPCSIFSFSLLRKGDSVDTVTLLSCAAAITLGSYLGSRLVNKIQGRWIKKIMTAALMVSFVILVIKMTISSGLSGTATSLSGVKLVIAVIACFITGLINMFGIPMKPTWTALFLILGLSPISTLTMVQSVGYFGPLSGGIHVIKSGNYHQKTAVSAVIFGSIGAVIGVTLALSISQGVLNIVLLLVMALAILSIIFDRPEKAS